MTNKTFNKDDLILINNVTYKIIKLIGHGKGGYSYLATNENIEVAIKKFIMNHVRIITLEIRFNLN